MLSEIYQAEIDKYHMVWTLKKQNKQNETKQNKNRPIEIETKGMVTRRERLEDR